LCHVLLLGEARCGNRNKKIREKQKIDFTEARVQRGRKTKRRIAIVECIPVKNIFEKTHYSLLDALFLANILLLI